jgi:hypothetical protein
MLGLSLSYNQPVAKMPAVAARLLPRGGSHVKFLESIAVWLDITAPRYWWQQFDTYRIGITKQSESTMHTLLKRPLVQADLERPIPETVLDALNERIAAKRFDEVKALLPEGFLQRRIVCTNYKALRHIVGQRHDHRLAEWQTFIRAVLEQVEHPEYLTVGVM